MNYRISKKSILFALTLSSLLVIVQIFKNLKYFIFPIHFFESPYTRWFSIDPFSFSSVVFFIILPIIASIPASSILKEDIISGLINKVLHNHSIPKIISIYSLTSFVLGFVVIAIPLLTNLLFYFTIFPNIKPNAILNENLLIISQNTQLAETYFNHPLFHALIFIFFAAFWGGLFAALNCILSLYFKNKLLSIFAAQFLQLLILALNLFIKLPNIVSYSPADFVKETASANVDVLVSLTVSFVFVFLTITLGIIGRYKKLVW